MSSISIIDIPSLVSKITFMKCISKVFDLKDIKNVNEKMHQQINLKYNF